MFGAKREKARRITAEDNLTRAYEKLAKSNEELSFAERRLVTARHENALLRETHQSERESLLRVVANLTKAVGVREVSAEEPPTKALENAAARMRAQMAAEDDDEEEEDLIAPAYDQLQRELEERFSDEPPEHTVFQEGTGAQTSWFAEAQTPDPAPETTEE